MSVARSLPLNIVVLVVGWVYAAAGILSFYPQVETIDGRTQPFHHLLTIITEMCECLEFGIMLKQCVAGLLHYGSDQCMQ